MQLPLAQEESFTILAVAADPQGAQVRCRQVSSDFLRLCLKIIQN
jgi:hypothetical protein